MTNDKVMTLTNKIVLSFYIDQCRSAYDKELMRRRREDGSSGGGSDSVDVKER